MKKMNDSSKISGSCCPMKRYKLTISEKNNIFVMDRIGTGAVGK